MSQPDQVTGSLYDVHGLEHLTQIITHVCTIISMFGIGCKMTLEDFQRKETQLSKSLCVGLFLQTLINPFAGFVLAILLDMEKHEALAMLTIASGPTAAYAGVLTFWGRGNIALSVCIATLSTALSIGMMPMWFYFYSSTWSQEFFIVAYPVDIALYMLLIIGPAALGMSFRWCLPKVAKQLARICSPVFLVSVVACSVLFLVFHRDNFKVDWQMYMSCFLLPFIGFFLGFLMAISLGMPYDVCIAISLAVGSSNGPLAITVALHSFDEAPEQFVMDVLSLPTIYALLAPIEGILWSLVYKTIGEMFTKGHPAVCGAEEEA